MSKVSFDEEELFLDLLSKKLEEEEVVVEVSPLLAIVKVPWPSSSMTRLMDREGCFEFCCILLLG